LLKVSSYSKEGKSGEGDGGGLVWGFSEGKDKIGGHQKEKKRENEASRI